jgi:hypothetical protein
MRRLPDNYLRNGFSYRKIRRENLICLYEVSFGELLIYYFVFIVQERPSKVFKNKHIPAYERMPRAELYGRSGWILKNLDAATIKFDALMAREKRVSPARQRHI